MAVARRAVDRHARVHQPLARRINVVDAIGEMAEIAAAVVAFGRAAVLGRPVIGQLDLGDVFLSRRREEDQGEAARLAVEAAHFVQPDQFEEIGTLAKCSPPIRDLENQKGMWEKLFNGEIDCLVSDHSPCPPEMKAGNIMEAWGGIAGLQNCMDVMFDEAVQKRGMSLPMFGKLMATNAADIFGLQQKGRIAPGKDADFVFIQPNSSYVLTNDDLEYRHKVSPYVGRTIGARITKTILRGDVIYDIEQGFPVAPKGQFILKHQQ